jgi:hypothetical protein
MSDDVLELIQHINGGQQGKFVTGVNDILSRRAADALVDVKKQVAANMFAEPEEDAEDDTEESEDDTE